MRNQSQPNYQRQFLMLAIRYLPHHAMLSVQAKRTGKRSAKRPYLPVPKPLSKLSLKTFSKDHVLAYTQAAKQALLWHGTGRFQYSNGTIVDTFESILKSGSLNPTHDVYSMVITGKPMNSISAIHSRIIARSYADTHGKGLHESDRYGSSLWWAAYYYSLFYAEMTLRHGLTLAKNWKAFSAASMDHNGERTWGKKTNTRAKDVWDVFGLGSDIEGNYPIIFGIKKCFEATEIPKSMQKWEARTTSSIKISDLSHIEVPEKDVAEVSALLANYGFETPVFPIELGEYVASQQQLVELLYRT